MYIKKLQPITSIKSSSGQAMSGFGITFFVVTFISLVLLGYGGEKHLLSEEEKEDMDLERQLSIINKPAVKTIKTGYGDIIDCVDIYKQPAFDHPLLKNHKIQMKPSSTPPVRKESPLLGKPVKVSESNGCPYGSVPIRRTTKQDLIRSKISKPANSYASPAPTPDSHFEIVSVVQYPPGSNFYGARAHINSYNPKVEYGQSSAAQIWIAGGPSDQVNSIEVGWVVDPGLYGDKRTRLFTYWTGDGYKKTGCYNILCPGFVHVDSRTTLGEPISNTSTYDGDQFIIMALVYKDEKTGNWWFVFTDDNIFVGYWPKELFPHLAGGAPIVAYGGRAQGDVNHLSPPMGSGFKPDDSARRFYHACFFANVQFVNIQNELFDPIGITKTFNDISGCYGLQNFGEKQDLGYTFLFGGPGGHCGS